MTNKTDRKPPNFNWVSVRSQCSVKQMFEDLRLGIKQDVEAINEIIQQRPATNPPRVFKISENSRTVKVFIDGVFEEGPSIVFVLMRDAIKVGVAETNETLFVASIGLNHDGDCRFIVSGEEYDSWQVRRKALEGIFFKDTVAE